MDVRTESGSASVYTVLTGPNRSPRTPRCRCSRRSSPIRRPDLCARAPDIPRDSGGDRALLAKNRERYPSIAELAEPSRLRLARRRTMVIRSRNFSGTRVRSGDSREREEAKLRASGDAETREARRIAAENFAPPAVPARGGHGGVQHRPPRERERIDSAEWATDQAAQRPARTTTIVRLAGGAGSSARSDGLAMRAPASARLRRTQRSRRSRRAPAQTVAR